MVIDNPNNVVGAGVTYTGQRTGIKIFVQQTAVRKQIAALCNAILQAEANKDINYPTNLGKALLDLLPVVVYCYRTGEIGRSESLFKIAAGLLDICKIWENRARGYLNKYETMNISEYAYTEDGKDFFVKRKEYYKQAQICVRHMTYMLNAYYKNGFTSISLPTNEEYYEARNTARKLERQVNTHELCGAEYTTSKKLGYTAIAFTALWIVTKAKNMDMILVLSTFVAGVVFLILWNFEFYSA